MRRTGKILTLALALTLIFALAMPAAAANETKTVTLTYRGVQVAVDGQYIVPADAAGNPVEPFIISGTTYLPLRAIAGALGLGVAWDDAASTVTLTSGGEKKTGSGSALATEKTVTASVTYRDIKLVLDGKPLTPKDAAGNTVEPFIMNGTTYLPLRAIASALGVTVGWVSDTSTAWLGKAPAQTLWVMTGVKNYENGALTGSAQYTYDARGNMTRLVSGDYVQQTTYDAAGNPVEITDNGGDWQRSTFDAAGNQLTLTDSSGYSGKWTYDAAGNILSVEIDDYRATYTYDAMGNELTARTSDGYSTVNTYNKTGKLLSSVTYRDGAKLSTETYTYDAVGRVTTYVYAWDTGKSTEVSSYDAHGNLIKCVYTSSQGFGYTDSYQYTYDAAGNILTELWKQVDSTGAFGTGGYYTYRYNAGGLILESVSYSLTATGATIDPYRVVNTYDAAGNLLSSAETDPDGSVWESVYTYQQITL